MEYCTALPALYCPVFNVVTQYKQHIRIDPRHGFVFLSAHGVAKFSIIIMIGQVVTVRRLMGVRWVGSQWICLWSTVIFCPVVNFNVSTAN